MEESSHEVSCSGKCRDDFYQTTARFLLKITLGHSDFNQTLLKALAWQDQQISPSFNMYLVINKRITITLWGPNFPAWLTFKAERNKTTLLFFNIVSLYFNTLFNWYINLAIDSTIYPSQHFPFGAAFVRQTGNFLTLLRNIFWNFSRHHFRNSSNLDTGVFYINVN